MYPIIYIHEILSYEDTYSRSVAISSADFTQYIQTIELCFVYITRKSYKIYYLYLNLICLRFGRKTKKITLYFTILWLGARWANVNLLKNQLDIS